MRVTVLAFAQAQERLGFRERVIDCSADDSPRAIIAALAPDFDGAAMRVAVDCEYHDWDGPIGAASELAIIPPVSGG